MLALGAIVAPVVFHMVPAPASGDAMTTVFRRFDTVAMSCAVLILLSEGARAFAGAVSRLDAARLATAIAAGALAIVQGVWLSPAIEALHRGGAIRGVGEAGLELDAKHHIAEMGGKAQAALLAALLVMLVVSASRKAGAKAASHAREPSPG
jgi:hypothetical protein